MAEPGKTRTRGKQSNSLGDTSAIDLNEWKNPINAENYGKVVDIANGEGYHLKIFLDKKHLYRIARNGRFLGKYSCVIGSVTYKKQHGDAIVLDDPEDTELRSKLYVKFHTVH